MSMITFSMFRYVTANTLISRYLSKQQSPASAKQTASDKSPRTLFNQFYAYTSKVLQRPDLNSPLHLSPRDLWHTLISLGIFLLHAYPKNIAHVLLDHSCSSFSLER